MRFTKPSSLPKAIKNAKWMFLWIHLSICGACGVWGLLAWAGTVPWHQIAFMILFHTSIYTNIGLWALRRRRIYRQAMAARYMLCDDCLYDLREVTAPVCPECGKEFTRSSLRRAWLWEVHARRRFRQRWGW